MKVARAYFELKAMNKKPVYLFKNGAFYLALNDDALFLRSLGYKNKIITFGTNDIKMGFPCSERDKLERMLKEDHIEFEFIEDYKPVDYNQYLKQEAKDGIK